MTNEAIVEQIRAAGGDTHTHTEELGQLYQQNQGLVRKAVRRFNGIIDQDDAGQECYLAMLRAVNRYDPQGGTRFSTYFFAVMMRHLYRIAGSTTAAAVPEHMRGKCGRLRKAREVLTQRLGAEPSRSDLAEYLGLTVDQVEQIQGYNRALAASSLDTPLSESEEGDSLTIGDTLSSGEDEAAGVLDRVQREELAAVIWEEVDALKPSQAAVIRGRYQDGETLEQIGQRRGISTARVRQIETDALHRLRRGRARARLLPYLTDKAAVVAYRGRMQRTRAYGEASPTEAAALDEVGDLSYIDYIMGKYGTD